MPASEREPGHGADWRRSRLHVVSGKGGSGKTTVASALALALAADGRRVLLVEVEERQGIARLFDLPPLSYAEHKIAVASGGGEVRALAIDVEAALLEYFELFYNLGIAGRTLKRMGAVEFATTLAPGLRDVLLTGKIKETVARRDRQGRPIYDAVVVDAPPTGRIVTFLNVTVAMADLARRGPIRNQADGVIALLHSPQTQVHLVTLLEDMPTTETLDAVGELQQAGLPVGSVIINAATCPRLPADAAPVGRKVLAAGLTAAGVTADPELVAGLETEAADHRTKLRSEAACRQRLAAAGVPLLELPRLIDGADLGGVYELAELLAEQGGADD